MQDRTGMKNKLMPQDWQSQNIMMRSKVKDGMPQVAEMDLPHMDASNLTADQVRELAQPIHKKRLKED